MVALKPVVGWTAAVGLCVAVAAVGITPVGAKPKATSWDKQGLTGIRGIDVSRWQHVGPGRLDFPALQAQGVRFVIIKSGDSYPSAHSEAGYWYRRDKAAAKRAGMLVGAYYYAVPTSRAKHVIADARAQGRKAAARVGKLPKGHLPLALDLESDGTALGPANLTRWTLAWLRTVKKRTGRTPWLYSYTRYLERRLLPDPALFKYPLWHANWGLYLDQEPLPIAGWPTSPWRIWQFTDSGKLRGSGSSVLDLNVWRGTGRELLAEAGLKPKAAQRFDIPLDGPQPSPSPSPTVTTSVSPSPSP